MDAGVVSGLLHLAPQLGADSESSDPGKPAARAKGRPPFGLRRRGAVCGVAAQRS